jgi:hypothetical protein
MSAPAATLPAAPRHRRRLLTPVVLFVLLVLAGYSGLALNPGVQQRLGLAQSQVWFLDSYAILASSDAVQAGLDPFLPNPLDVLQRPHSYSSWWFWLGRLGFTRADNFLIGGLWVLAFFGATFALLRPRSYGAALWYALIVLSPPVQLAVLRANNDLVVFVLVAAGVLTLGAATWRLALFAATLLLATGLKFYPLVAGAALVLLRPARRMLVAGGLTLLGGLLVLAAVRSDLRRAVIPFSPDHVHTIGAPILFRDLGWTGRGPLIAGVLLLVLPAAFCAQRRWTKGLADETGDFLARRAFACGAALLVACFLAGISNSYRLVFAILLAPWLWQQAFAAAQPARVARLAAGLLLAMLWFDGLFCLWVNCVLGPQSMATLDRLQGVWGLGTQPLVWGGMVLLAGWLIEALLQAWTDARKSL